MVNLVNLAAALGALSRVADATAVFAHYMVYTLLFSLCVRSIPSLLTNLCVA